MNQKKFKRNVIFTVCMYILVLTGLLIYWNFQSTRLNNLKEGGLRKLYAYDAYSISSSGPRGRGHSVTNYIRFSTTIDEKRYTLSISTDALGKDDNKLFTLNSDNCIERYVLYSDDLTVAFDENVTQKEYARSHLVAWLLVNLAVILFAVTPLLTHYLFLKKAKPSYKGNTHSRNEERLICWYGDIHISHVMIDWVFFIAIFFIIIIWTQCDVDEAWLRYALTGVMSPFLFMPLLFFVTNKSYIVIYDDEFVWRKDGDPIRYAKKDVTSYQRLTDQEGKYAGYKINTTTGGFNFGTASFTEEELTVFLKKHGYIQ